MDSGKKTPAHFVREGGTQYRGQHVETLQEAKAAQLDPSRVVKIDKPRKNDVTDYQLPPLGQGNRREYAVVREKFGPLAVTDERRSHLPQKDRHFEINPILRGPLSIDEEERRVIDERVEASLRVLAEEARVRGQQEGYQAGLEKGYTEAFKRFQQEATERLTHLDGLLEFADRAKQELATANERLLLELVFRASRMVLLRELSADPDYVRRLILELVEATSARENIRIRVNPEDFSTVTMLSEKLGAPGSPYKNVKIEPSTQVARGGVKIETDWDSIEASTDAQLEAIHQALVGQSLKKDQTA